MKNASSVKKSFNLYVVRRKDRCQPNPCINGGSCTEVANGYECTCQNGYKGQNCQGKSAYETEPLFSHDYYCFCLPAKLEKIDIMIWITSNEFILKAMTPSFFYRHVSDLAC